MSEQPRTLLELLATLRSSDARVVFPGTDVVLSHRELPDRAHAMARLLRASGVRAGDVVGLLMPTSPEWLPGYFGVPVAGAVVTALPLPPIVLDPPAVALRLRAIVIAGRIRHVVASGVGLAVAAELATLCPGLVVVDARDARVTDEPGITMVADPDSPAVVQFSSGSTSRPKGVVLSHRAVLAGVSAINSHIRTTPDDVLVQWVPLFHDMGVVALLCSLLTPNDAHLFSPMAFVRSPGAILAHIADVGGTIVTGPNFSYDKFAEAAATVFGATTVEKPLRRWRLALNGAELVQARTLDAFASAFSPLGVPESTMYPCYGMAEATLAVTLPRLGSPPRTVTVDRKSVGMGDRVVLLAEGSPQGRVLVSVGVPVPGMEVLIEDEDGCRVSEGWLGEIVIAGPAVTSGYLNDDETTSAVLRDGRLRTGDLGFRHDGELFIAGRLKEMIIIQGRNFFPEDVEEAVRSLSSIHRGHCIAIADPEAERMAVVAEVERSAEAEVCGRVTLNVRRVVSAVLGLSAVDVILVPPRALPRTTSGKWQRSLVADLVRQHRSVIPISRRKQSAWLPRKP